MRLLEIHAKSSLRLVDVTGCDIPKYAILSHTWGHDYEEVTFDDLSKGIGTSKPGFRKLAFCAEQADKDGLRFFWVDTCCIDKTNSTELTEAINSMFQWYQNAAKCYAYLSDVTINNLGRLDLLSNRSWNDLFRNSRWFTRGWTLQELLAPTSVEFFSSDGRQMGSRNSLRREIQDITGIPTQALQGRPLCQFDIKERLSWVEGRETKRQEDMAYSLLGIFGVFIPLIYGEGRNNALHRLLNAIRDAGQSFEPETLSLLQSNTAGAVERIRSVELDWENFMESREERGSCFNCGSQDHWERDCLKHCGRCKAPLFDAQNCHKITSSGLYRGHSVSSCSFPIRCMKCKGLYINLAIYPALTRRIKVVKQDTCTQVAQREDVVNNVSPLTVLIQCTR